MMMEKNRKYEKKGKIDQRLKISEERSSIFNNAQMCSMAPTSAFGLIEEDFKGVIQEGPTYICDICWKFKFQSNVIKLHDSKYQLDTYKCAAGKSDWICKSCRRSLLKTRYRLK